MTRILRIELRRSAAAGTALALLLVGAALLYAAPQQWAPGWMSLAMVQRMYLVLLWPLALAAGAWQARREQRSNVTELFASTARPRAQRVAPTLAALGIAVASAYVAMAAVAVPSIIDTASYLPAAGFAVMAVGALSLIAAAWLGLAVGRLVPSLVTAPALAVAGIGLLLIIPVAVRHREWLAMVFSPMYGMGQYTDYQTVHGRVSAAQGIWLAALAVTGVVLLAAGNWRTRVAALLPAVLGASAAILVIPRGADFVEHPIDPVARETVCADGSPRVCVSRIHAALLPEVTPLARQGLAMLAKLPNPPTTAVENRTTYFDEETPEPQRPDTVLIRVRVGSNGRLADKEYFLPGMLQAAGASASSCPEGLSRPVAAAVAYWLMEREPLDDPSEPAEVNAQTRTLWQGLRKLPEREAAARVVAVRRAALACENLDGLLTRGAA